MKDASLILHYLDPVRVVSGEWEARVTMLGPKFIWHTDGYDIGLCINGWIFKFSRTIIWVNVYQTNNHPKLIGGYFLEAAITANGGCPSKNKDRLLNIEWRCSNISNISKAQRSWWWQTIQIWYKYKKSKDWELMGALCNFGLNCLSTYPTRQRVFHWRLFGQESCIVLFHIINLVKVYKSHILKKNKTILHLYSVANVKCY